MARFVHFLDAGAVIVLAIVEVFFAGFASKEVIAGEHDRRFAECGEFFSDSPFERVGDRRPDGGAKTDWVFEIRHAHEGITIGHAVVNDDVCNVDKFIAAGMIDGSAMQ